MTTATAPPITNTMPAINGAALLQAAAELGPAVAMRAEQHDRDGTFVDDSFALLRQSGYLASPVPTELGGGGATTAQVAWAQHELARHCGSTALASTMHLHVVLTNAWRFRRGLPGAEGMLRKVADNGVIVASTGGGDFTVPTGLATRVDGGWEISGRKSFVSGAPAADIASSWAVTDEGQAIGFGFSMTDPAVTVVENWDAPGMRGTASHDVVLDRLFVADAAVTAQRQPGDFAPVLAILGAKALTVIAATYLGVAVGARDAVIEMMRGSSRADDAGVRRSIGLMEQHLLTARCTLAGVLDELGEDPEPTTATLAKSSLAKRAVIESARAVGDLAMDIAGGRAYRRGHVVERAWRDLRAGPFHPLEHELTLRVAGDVALDRPPSLGS